MEIRAGASPSESSGKLAGILAMAATAFLWSIAGLVIKKIDWNPIAISGTRSLIASLVILLYLRRPKFNFSFPQVAASVSLALTMMLFVTANKTTTAANAILLQYLAPVLTAFIGAKLLREKPRAEHFAAFPFVALGMLLMFSGELSGGRLHGNIIAVASAFTFSFYFIFMRMQKDGSPLESNLLAHWMTAAVCLLISLFLPAPTASRGSLVAIMVLGVIQIGIPAILFAFAIKKVSAVSATLVAVIEPVFNPVWVFLAIGESPGPNAVWGGAIIILAVTAASVASSRRKPAN